MLSNNFLPPISPNQSVAGKKFSFVNQPDSEPAANSNINESALEHPIIKEGKPKVRRNDYIENAVTGDHIEVDT